MGEGVHLLTLYDRQFRGGGWRGGRGRRTIEVRDTLGGRGRQGGTDRKIK